MIETVVSRLYFFYINESPARFVVFRFAVSSIWYFFPPAHVFLLFIPKLQTIMMERITHPGGPHSKWREGLVIL